MIKNSFLLLFLLCLCCCVYNKSEKYNSIEKDCCKTEGLFKGKWEDYYECALSCIEDESYEQSIVYLNHALSVKKKDKRKIRTYGVHIIDYFPHREKGMSFFFLGQYKQALKELKTSIQQEPSAKAFYYRDEVIKLLRHDDKITTPDITATIMTSYYQLNDVYWTNDMAFDVAGIVRDINYINQITINGQDINQESSLQNIKFSKKIMFSQGNQQIDIVAKNILGGVNKKIIKVYIDRSGPLITLKHIDNSKGLTLHIFDDTGEINLIVNNKIFLTQQVKSKIVDIPNTLLKKENTIQAIDKLGNISTLELQNDMNHQYQSSLYIAQNKTNIMTDSGYGMFTKPDQTIKVFIKGISESNNTAYKNIISLTGKISAKNDIDQFIINETSLLKTKGQSVSFNIPIHLNEGNNEIQIFAKEKSGVPVRIMIPIFKKLSQAHCLENRFVIKIKSFGGLYRNNSIESEEEIHFKNIFTDIMKQKKRFQVLNNSEYNKSPDALLYGKVRKRKNGIEIITRLIDTQTRRIMKIGIVKDIYIPSIRKISWKSSAKQISENIHNEFPLMTGIIKQINDNNAVVDFEKREVKMYWPLVIFRQKHPDHVLGSETDIVDFGVIDGAINDQYIVEMKNQLREPLYLFAITM